MTTGRRSNESPGGRRLPRDAAHPGACTRTARLLGVRGRRRRGRLGAGPGRPGAGPRAGRLEHAEGVRDRGRTGTGRTPGPVRDAGGDGHHRDRGRPCPGGTRHRCRRVPDEAVHEGSRGREARRTRTCAVTENVAQLPARVLVVDDAVVARRIISDTLEAEADLTVAGYARDGDSALRRAAELQPDVVVLDLDLPGRSGVEILSELRRRHPQLPVVVFSRLVLDDPSIIPAMLSRGAAACLAKPGTRDGIGLSVDDVRSRLTAAVRTAAASPRAIAPRTIAPRITLRRTTVPATTEAIVIAASTGGPMALERLVSDLPSDLPVPVFVVQHMPPPFPRMLANRLRRTGCLTVTEAGDREPAHPGRVYLAPGGHHLTVGGIRSHPVTFLD